MIGVSIVFAEGMGVQGGVSWQRAEYFGARCFPAMADHVTHVVATTGESDLARHARRLDGVVLVHEDWLQACEHKVRIGAGYSHL